MSGQLILVTGGIKSGKSIFAEELASKCGNDVLYVATALAGDLEMQKKIQIHRNRRPMEWQTLEEPYNIKDVFRDHSSKHKVILIDCLTMLISNLIFREDGVDSNQISEATYNNILEEMKLTLTAARSSESTVIAVTSEVGLSLVSEYSLGRKYQELVGSVNQLFTHIADSVYLVVAGCPVAVKGGINL